MKTLKTIDQFKAVVPGRYILTGEAATELVKQITSQAERIFRKAEKEKCTQLNQQE